MTSDERLREEPKAADISQIPDIATTPAWNALVRHHDQIGSKHLREFFADDPTRGTELTVTVGDLYIDYSKHRVTRETMSLLVDLAKEADLERHRDEMFSGVHINTSEDRAVLHTALRLPPTAELVVAGQNVVTDVHEVLGRMGDFTDRLRNGEWTGATGERITARSWSIRRCVTTPTRAFRRASSPTSTPPTWWRSWPTSIPPRRCSSSRRRLSRRWRR
jgi:glucose-6-phosphate isomerase